MKKDILLVEDNPDDIALSMEVFDLLGIKKRVKIAQSGEEALNMLSDKHGDKLKRWKVILLDLNLPGINGTKVLEKIRQNPDTESIPVVMLTSSNRQEDISASYHGGVNSYVCKPVNFKEFVKLAKTLKFYWSDINQVPYC